MYSYHWDIVNTSLNVFSQYICPISQNSKKNSWELNKDATITALGDQLATHRHTGFAKFKHFNTGLVRTLFTIIDFVPTLAYNYYNIQCSR